MFKLFGIPLYKRYVKKPKKLDPLGIFIWIIAAIPLSFILLSVPLIILGLIIHTQIPVFVLWIIISIGAVIIAYFGIKINPWYVGYESAMRADSENEMPPFANFGLGDLLVILVLKIIKKIKK
jgi:hypothetical protein